MSVSRIKALLQSQADDERISLVEVQQLIDAATDEGVVTVGESFLLRAALDANQGRFTPDAYEALKHFLEGTGK